MSEQPPRLPNQFWLKRWLPKELPPPPRTEKEIKADAAQMLTESYLKTCKRWGIAP